MDYSGYIRDFQKCSDIHHLCLKKKRFPDPLMKMQNTVGWLINNKYCLV